MSEELKPCPFCGSKDVYLDWHKPLFEIVEMEFVICGGCGAMGKHIYGDRKAIEAWNRRANERTEID